MIDGLRYIVGYEPVRPVYRGEYEQTSLRWNFSTDNTSSAWIGWNKVCSVSFDVGVERGDG